jgi:hypothetical protein
VYESYINGCGKVVFDNDDLTRIIDDYKLMVDEENIMPVVYIQRKPVKRTFKPGLDLEILKQRRRTESNRSQQMKRFQQLYTLRSYDPWMNQPLIAGSIQKKRKTIKRKNLVKRNTKKTKKTKKQTTKRKYLQRF